MVTKLAQLCIGEVSGVDDPANMLPGFMVLKSAAGKRPFGEDTGTWDVAAAEKRIREATGAEDGPTPVYASCFLWYDGEGSDANGDGFPDQFSDYRFLVCDVDTEGVIKVMPAAVRAAAERAPGSSIPEDDKAELQKAVEVITATIAGNPAPEAVAEEAQTLVGKLKALIPGLNSEKEIDMDKEELNGVLDERFEAFGNTLVERLSKSVEAPVTPEAPAPVAEAPATEEVPAAPLSEDDIVKAVETTLQPVLEILDKALDRIAGCESKLGVVARKSLEGQETPEDGVETPATPTLKDAIVAALPAR